MFMRCQVWLPRIIVGGVAVLVASVCVQLAYASEPTYVWTQSVGGASTDIGEGVTIDGSGNVYAVGRFDSASVDFDDTGGTDTHSTAGSSDIFITKYASDGSYGWTQSIGGTGSDFALDVATDSSGNVYAVGSFSSASVDFDDTGGTDTHSTAGSSDIFITKYTSDGSYGWTRSIGSTSADQSRSVAVDGSGNVYAVGYFQGTDVNFDDTGGTDNHTSVGSWDIFITKYTSDGSYGWTQSFGGTSTDYANGIAIDSSDNVYIAGAFSSTSVDFDATGGTDTHTSDGSGAMFITKYTSDGSYGWTQSFGGTGGNGGEGYNIATDSTNVYATGFFYGDVDFDGSAGTDTKSSDLGADNAFITAYTTTGSYGWTHIFGSSSAAYGYGVAAEDSEVYLTGTFAGSNVDFDDTAGTDTHSSNGSQDIFLTNFSSAGAYDWTFTYGSSTASDFGHEVAVNGTQLALTGYFRGSNVDLDGTTGSDTHTSASSSNDIFITQYAVASSGGSPGSPSSLAESSATSNIDHSVSLREGTVVVSKTTTLTRRVLTVAQKDLQVTARPTDADQVQRMTLRTNGQIHVLTDNNEDGIFDVILPAFAKPGTYAYALTADWGTTTSTEHGEFIVEPDSLTVAFVNINYFFRLVYERTPTFSEWHYWVARRNDKPTVPAFYGALQYHRLKNIEH